MYEEIVEDNARIFQLADHRIADGWTIDRRVDRAANQTGGNFSVGYTAIHEDGRRAFLKAIDYRKAFQAEDSAQKLELLTKTFNFEREVLKLCAGAKMSRVVVAITSGEIPAENLHVPIPYLIFELADGDVRRHVDSAHALDFGWSARALHHIAVALQQLHSKGISHQDVKPSNVLVFTAAGSKLADLGRASCTTLAAPHDDLILPGGVPYAPPEQLYRHKIDDRWAYRRAGDLYLFGSMMHFFVTGQPVTPQVLSKMRQEHLPKTWTGEFGDVLPYWRDAYGAVMTECRSKLSLHLGPANHQMTSRLFQLIDCTTEPDLALRGHPAARRRNPGNPYNLQQIVSVLNLVASQLEHQNLGKHAAATGRQAS